MKNILEPLKKIEKIISKEKGQFVLFGMFLKKDPGSKWDIVVSANWIGNEAKEFLTYFISKLNPEIKKVDLTTISSVVALKPSDPFVQTINQIIKTEHGDTRFTNCYFNNIEIKDAFIITSLRDDNVKTKSRGKKSK